MFLLFPVLFLHFTLKCTLSKWFVCGGARKNLPKAFLSVLVRAFIHPTEELSRSTRFYTKKDVKQTHETIRIHKKEKNFGKKMCEYGASEKGENAKNIKE
jgi:hypothetical protein